MVRSTTLLKRLLKLTISLAVWSFDTLTGLLLRLLGRATPNKGIVLYYHAVRPEQRALFGRQMDLVLSVAQPWDLRNPMGKGPRNSVAITFDDGYSSVLQNALPELIKRNIPFSFFVPTGNWDARPAWIHSSAHPSFQERVISQDELQALCTEPLAMVGSHSITHPNFLSIGRETAAREFKESKSQLERLIGKPVTSFSFPHGAHNPQLVEMAMSYGYCQLYTVEPDTVGPNSTMDVIGRFPVEPDDWMIEYFLKLKGANRWQMWIKNIPMTQKPHPEAKTPHSNMTARPDQ